MLMLSYMVLVMVSFWGMIYALEISGWLALGLLASCIFSVIGFIRNVPKSSELQENNKEKDSQGENHV